VGSTGPDRTSGRHERLTINDVIDAANTTHASHVVVRWPTGQDRPTSVWVDTSATMADEEIGCTILHVTAD